MRKPILLSLLALAACATTPPPRYASDKPAGVPQEVVSIPTDPYPSTYHPYPSVTTVIQNATIYDGKGGKLVGGAVRLENGKVAEIGQTVTVPAGARVIDAGGKYVTPGIIDIHSHMGDYPAPGVEANSDGNEASTSPNRDPRCGPNIRCGRRTRSSPARWPAASPPSTSCRAQPTCSAGAA